MVALSALYLWLVSGQKLIAFGSALHDDELFLSLGRSIASGDWLGPFGNLTLAKGPFYSMWIAAVFVLGVPLQLSHHLLHVAACVVMIVALRPVVRSAGLLVLMYAVILFNPVMFSLTRVLREGIYIPLSLVLAACLVGLLVRRARAPRTLAAWGGGAGLALGAMWLTREETLWILPTVLFVLALAAMLEWRRRGPRLWQRCVVLVTPLVVLGVFIVLVSAVNWYHYGAFVVTEVGGADWRAAYGALSRVQHDSHKRYLVVPRHVRERIYGVSPAFAVLRPSLEGELGRSWQTPGCRMMPETCGDITGAWFMWLLRDAVAGAGYYRSAPAALAYYRRLADEVNAACDAGSLRCGPPRATMMPPWRREYAPELWRSMKVAARHVVQFQAITVYSTASYGDERALLPFRLMTRDRLAPSADTLGVRISGWGFGTETDLVMTIRDGTGTDVDTSLRRVGGQDIFEHFVKTEGRRYERARDSRFVISAACLRDCTLVVRALGQDRILGTIPLDGSVRWLVTPDVRLHVSDIARSELSSLRGYPVDAFKLRVMAGLVWLYGVVTPLLTGILVVALVGSAVALAFGHRSALLLLLVVLGSTIVARILLIALIDATAFPSITAHYLGPAHVLLVAACVLACFELASLGRVVLPRSALLALRSRLRSPGRPLAVSLAGGALIIAALAVAYVWLWRSPATPAAAARPFCCRDMNGDGRPDVLWRQSSGPVAVWLLSGLRVTANGQPSAAVSNDWTVVGLGDFNGDRKADILWRQASGTIAIWLFDGTSLMETAVLPNAAPADATVLGVGDFNGDGKADILWQGASGTVSIWFLDGKTVVGTAAVGAVPAGWTFAGIGDFNGDGKADVVWRQASGAAAVWLLNGASIVGTGVPGQAPADWSVAGVGDVNGDGKADIVWRQASGAAAVWLLNGTAIAGTGVAGQAPADWSVVGVGDFNGDGKADLLWQSGAGVVTGWFLDGTRIVGTGALTGNAPAGWRIQ
jgi:hypothetical protein